MGGLVPLLIVKFLYTTLFINNTEFVVKTKTKRAQEFWYQPLFSLRLFLGFRRSLKARLLFRGVVYSLIALVGGVWLGIKVPTLWIIYGLAIIAFLTDFVAVYLQQQESIAAVCLSTPFVGQPMAIGIIGYGVYSC